MTTVERIEAVKAYCREFLVTCEGAVDEDVVHAINRVKRHVLSLLGESREVPRPSAKGSS